MNNFLYRFLIGPQTHPIAPPCRSLCCYFHPTESSSSSFRNVSYSCCVLPIPFPRRKRDHMENKSRKKELKSEWHKSCLLIKGQLTTAPRSQWLNMIKLLTVRSSQQGSAIIKWQRIHLVISPSLRRSL